MRSTTRILKHFRSEPTRTFPLSSVFEHTRDALTRLSESYRSAAIAFGTVKAPQAKEAQAGYDLLQKMLREYAALEVPWLLTGVPVVCKIQDIKRNRVGGIERASRPQMLLEVIEALKKIHIASAKALGDGGSSRFLTGLHQLHDRLAIDVCTELFGTPAGRLQVLVKE